MTSMCVRLSSSDPPTSTSLLGEVFVTRPVRGGFWEGLVGPSLACPNVLLQPFHSFPIVLDAVQVCGLAKLCFD